METIDPKKLLVKIASILEKLGIEYFVTGGMAISVWGHPRSTVDIDVVIQLFESQISPLAKLLREISSAGYIDEDTAREAVSQKGEFNFIDPDSGLKVDFWITPENEKSRLEFKRRRLEQIGEQSVYFISPEDLILSKLLWHKESGSERQLEDVKSVLKTQDRLDFEYLKKWARIQSTGEILKNLLTELKSF